MVVGYICVEHDYQHECDTGEAGERLCPECGVAVTGLVGQARSTHRSPPTDSHHAEGGIRWRVRTDTTESNFTVDAFDLEDAVEAAIGRVENPQSIREVKPKNHRYRA